MSTRVDVYIEETGEVIARNMSEDAAMRYIQRCQELDRRDGGKRYHYKMRETR